MRTQNKQYQQLTLPQRYQIQAQLQADKKQKEIAEVIGVNPGTVSRELRKNSKCDPYCPDTAHEKAMNRRKTAKKAMKRHADHEHCIEEALKKGTSPECLAKRMKRECSKEKQLSHTTSYTRIEDNKQQGGDWHKMLLRYGKVRKKGGKRGAGVSFIPNRIDIRERPEIVNERSRIGDWEGDTVVSKGAYLVTLTERKTRLTLIKRVFSKTKTEVAQALKDMLTPLAHKGMVHTLTLDNGGEFAAHEEVAKATGAKVYFAKPYASYQRGTNENMNGRIRRWWPKKTDFSKVSDEDVYNIQLKLNFMPMLVLDGRTPLEAFTGKDVALIA